MRAKFGVGLMLLVATCGTGCMTHPWWEPERYQIGAPAPKGEIKAVVVSGFYWTDIGPETTQSRGLAEPGRDVRADDISLEVAAELQRGGVPARALAQFDPKSLKPGEVLLRGVIRRRDEYMPDRGRTQIMVFLCTMTVYGAVLPFVPSLPTGFRCEVRLDLIDSEGNIVLSARDDIAALRGHNWIWSMVWTDWRDRYAREVPRIVAAALAERLRGKFR